MVTKEERLSGVRLQTSAYGGAVPIYYGPNRDTGNILWYGDFQAIEHKQKQSSGGKGGGGAKSVSITYTYKSAFMVGIGEGEVAVQAVMPNKDGFKAPDQFGLEVFSGSVGQAPWGYLTSRHPGEALGYSGTGYVAAASYDLGGDASMPNFSFKLIGQPRLSGLGQYIQDFLTNPRYGAGFDLMRLDGLSAMDDWLTTQGVTFSPYAKERKPAQEYITDWCTMANVAIVPSDGKVKFIPRTDSVAVVAELGPDDFLTDGDEPPVRVERSDPADAFNMLQVSYLDAGNDYNTSVVDERDQANIDQFGLRPAKSETYNGIKSGLVAKWVASHRIARLLYNRNTYEFQLGWKHARLEPMDVVTLTEPLLGLVSEPAQIISIEEDEDGLLTVVAEEYSGLVTGIVNIPPADTPQGAIVDQGIDPGDANEPVIFEPPTLMTPANPELWLATSGGENWGGCEVWASLDGDSYRRIGIMTGFARHGVLREDGPSPGLVGELRETEDGEIRITEDGEERVLDTSPGDVLQVSIYRGELLSGTPQDALDRVTLCWVEGELFSYADSELVAEGEYDLGGLVRGQYGTEAEPHEAGDRFVRVDESLFRYVVPKEWLGRQIWVKLTSFNVYGSGSQSLADVEAYTYTLQGQYVPGILGLTASAFQTSAVIEWAVPENVEQYSRIDILRSEISPPDINDAVLVAQAPPGAGRITDMVGVSNVECHYWVRLVTVHGELGALVGPASAITGSVGGVPVFSTVPTEDQGEIIYVRADESLYEWDGVSAYVRSQPLVAANKIVAGTITAALTMTAANIVGGSLNIANRFMVSADGTTTIKSAATGERMEITNEAIKVFDSNGVLRVQLGDLSA